MQLTCINETRVYRWRRLNFNWKEDIDPIYMSPNSEVATLPPTKIYLLDVRGLWQYTIERNTWEVIGILDDPDVIVSLVHSFAYGNSVLTASHYIRFDMFAKSACVYSFSDKRWAVKDHLGGFDHAPDLKPFVCSDRIFRFATRPPSPPVVVMEIGVDEDTWTWHTIRDPEMIPPKFDSKLIRSGSRPFVPIGDISSGDMYFVLGCTEIICNIQNFWKLSLGDIKWVKQTPFHDNSAVNIPLFQAATTLGHTGFVVYESQWNMDAWIVPVARVSSYSTHIRQWILYGCAQKLKEQPVVRHSTSVVSLNASSLLLFAGKQHGYREGRKWFNSELLDDTWILSMPDPDSNSRFVRWTLVNNYVRPLARERHSMAFIQNKVFLYGGADRRGQCINNVWTFDISSAQWSPIVTVGEGPEPSPKTLCYSTAAALGGHMIIVIRCPHEEKADCSPVGLQIWMFIAQSSRWTFLSHNEVYGRDWSYFVFHWRRRLVIFDSSKINLLISLLGCPPGFQSTNIFDIHTPCEQCPYGSYSHKGQLHTVKTVPKVSLRQNQELLV